MRECRRVGHAPPMGSTIEPTPLLLMWWEVVSKEELTYSSVRSDMGGGESAVPTPSTPEAGGRAGPTLISCSTQESNLYFSPI